MSPPAVAHVRRLQAHLATANVLRDQGDDWAAVAYFYAAFHGVRAALWEDRRLDTDASARAVHPKLSAGSRHVDFHEGHPTRGPGLNQVVRYLYPPIGSKYVLLHTRSVEVRYQEGLSAGSLDDVQLLIVSVLDFLQNEGLIEDT